MSSRVENVTHLLCNFVRWWFAFVDSLFFGCCHVCKKAKIFFCLFDHGQKAHVAIGSGIDTHIRDIFVANPLTGTGTTVRCIPKSEITYKKGNGNFSTFMIDARCVCTNKVGILYLDNHSNYIIYVQQAYYSRRLSRSMSSFVCLCSREFLVAFDMSLSFITVQKRECTASEAITGGT